MKAKKVLKINKKLYLTENDVIYGFMILLSIIMLFVIFKK